MVTIICAVCGGRNAVGGGGWGRNSPLSAADLELMNAARLAAGKPPIVVALTVAHRRCNACANRLKLLLEMAKGAPAANNSSPMKAPRPTAKLRLLPQGVDSVGEHLQFSSEDLASRSDLAELCAKLRAGTTTLDALLIELRRLRVGVRERAAAEALQEAARVAGAAARQREEYSQEVARAADAAARQCEEDLREATRVADAAVRQREEDLQEAARAADAAARQRDEDLREAARAADAAARHRKESALYEFSVGESVDVASVTTPGYNLLGGRAVVLARRLCTDTSNEYCARFVECAAGHGRRDSVHEHMISHTPDELARRRALPSTREDIQALVARVARLEDRQREREREREKERERE